MDKHRRSNYKRTERRVSGSWKVDIEAGTDTEDKKLSVGLFVTYTV
jgi:hypothetical protein